MEASCPPNNLKNDPKGRFRTYILQDICFLFFVFLVLPVYCYQPISLHPRAHMLSHVIPWTSARQTPRSWIFPGKNTGVGCHFLLQGYLFYLVVTREEEVGGKIEVGN